MTDHRPDQTIIADALAGRVICNIGQVSPTAIKSLNALAKLNRLQKWRGHWYPTPGAPYGLGPLKSCWGIARP